jgi:hypothetical protein
MRYIPEGALHPKADNEVVALESCTLPTVRDALSHADPSVRPSGVVEQLLQIQAGTRLRATEM